MPIINVLGDQNDMISPGRLVFDLDGVTHSLDALYETPEKKDLFIILRDRTSGESTYPAGRYLHVPLPVNGTTDVATYHPATSERVIRQSSTITRRTVTARRPGTRLGIVA